ncbi:MAG: peptidoglycan editing factor PgeF [Gammaproteobacteria bacterium]
MTTRQGGYSTAPYASFNLAEHVEDQAELVAKNRHKLSQDLNLKNEPFWLKQTHSTQVVCLDKLAFGTVSDADASYTTEANRVCVVLTADCLPILLASRDGDLVAAIHAGWQGLANGVIEATLESLPIDPKKLLAWFGPAIGPEAFVVQNDVRQRFLDCDANADAAFRSINKDSYLANIYLLARQRLEKYGITEVYGGDFCTFSDKEHFFSYRRDQGRTGRMASLIWIQRP